MSTHVVDLIRVVSFFSAFSIVVIFGIFLVDAELGVKTDTIICAIFLILVTIFTISQISYSKMPKAKKIATLKQQDLLNKPRYLYYHMW